MALTLLAPPNPASALSGLIQGLARGEKLADLISDVAFQLNPVAAMFLTAYQIAAALGLSKSGEDPSARGLRLLELLQLSPYEAAVAKVRLTEQGHSAKDVLGTFWNNFAREYPEHAAAMRQPPSPLWLKAYFYAQEYVQTPRVFLQRVRQAQDQLAATIAVHGRERIIEEMRVKGTSTPFYIDLPLLQIAAGFPD